jgi:regulator of replication initiation timing
MHKTKAGERRKTLKRESLELARDAKVLQKAAKTLPEAGHEAQRLQGDADKALEESEALKLQARLEDLTVWEMEKAKSTKKGTKTYTYWMVSWREGEKVRNVHLGSSRKMDAEEALQKARKMKAEALGRSQ